MIPCDHECDLKGLKRHFKIQKDFRTWELHVSSLDITVYRVFFKNHFKRKSVANVTCTKASMDTTFAEGLKWTLKQLSV